VGSISSRGPLSDHDAVTSPTAWACWPLTSITNELVRLPENCQRRSGIGGVKVTAVTGVARPYCSTVIETSSA
jgi:hypothetical protein